MMVNMFATFVLAVKGIEGESSVLRFIEGKTVIPLPLWLYEPNLSNITNLKKITDTDNTPMPSISPPPPHYYPTSTPLPKKRRPGQRERRRKYSMSKKTDDMIIDGELTEQEFGVCSIKILRDDEGKFIGFETTWDETIETPFSFYNNPETLIEKCDEFHDLTPEEAKEKLRKLEKERTGIEYDK